MQAAALAAAIVKEMAERSRHLSAWEAHVALRTLQGFGHFPKSIVDPLLGVLTDPRKAPDLFSGAFLVQVLRVPRARCADSTVVRLWPQ